jgi:3-phosphoshikimate 1-carboxyvinyltransferase
MLTIETRSTRSEVSIPVPGSKSYTHRSLIAAALSDGPCRITNPLRSEDTLVTLHALNHLGVEMQDQGAAVLLHGCSGRFKPWNNPIDFKNSGTSMRLFGGLVVLGRGVYTLTGSTRMQERPMGPLLDSLKQMGITAYAQKGNDCPPVIVEGNRRSGRHTAIDCSVSSQYLSALLLVAPCLENGLTIDVTKGPVSKPYIDMTIDIMDAFGVDLHRDGYNRFTIAGNQTYRAGDHEVEPDASNASYFWAAAALTGARVHIRGLTTASRQGDIGLVAVLERMGCEVTYDAGGIAVTGGPLRGVEVDMAHMPDVVPTLAVVAAFAQGVTTIRNVGHLRVKECDRLAAVSSQLAKMGIETHTTATDLHITGGTPHGAVIETYDDHRMAMSFAVAGLKVPGVTIEDPGCVAKSFPTYWEVFEQLY